jgi:dTDP-4-dehydrorhamnose 3,5-epimerase
MIEATDIPDVLLIAPPKYGDDRGFFSETFRGAWFEEAGTSLDFVQDNHSLSADTGTVRGLHFQIPPHAQDKLVRVVRGAVLDVAVDIRVGSPTFGQHVAEVLSAENWRQLLVPKGFAHGFCTLEPDTEVLYKVTAYYAPDHDKGLLWDDPALGIDWPVDGDRAVLSDKDRLHPPLADLPAYFTRET